jgi:hypothetical protein
MSTRFVLVTLVSAILLGSCSSPSDVRPGQCHPCTVSKDVGPLLKDAQSLAQAEDYKGAMAKVNEAEAVKVTQDDETVIDQMRTAFAVMQAQPLPGSAAAAKAKFARDYNAGKWLDVIADADMLKKVGALDAQAQLVIGQAYFNAGDYAGCVKYTKALDSDAARQLQTRCAYEVAKAAQP